MVERVSTKVVWIYVEGQRQKPAGTVHLSLTLVVTPRAWWAQEEKTLTHSGAYIIGSRDTPSRRDHSLRPAGPTSLPGLHPRGDLSHLCTPQHPAIGDSRLLPAGSVCHAIRTSARVK